MKQRTDAYRCTVQSKDSPEVEKVRQEVKDLNQRNTNPHFRWRVSIKGRLGKDNPYKDLYKNRSVYSVLHEHSQHFDVYVHRYYDDYFTYG